MFSFNNVNALVVGAASGIGRALAIEFARRGARIAVADIDQAGAARTATHIREAGGTATSVSCDVTDAAALAVAVRSAEEFLGSIDVCANAVGVLLSGNPEDIPVAEWERIFQVNVFGAARLNELLLSRMIARGSGYIVNTASVAGLHPFAITRIPYAASKAALISMSENLAIYLKPRGVRVSCLCPGPTATPIGGRSKEWTQGLPIVGPGRDYVLMTAQRTAQVFCDGMERERVIIPSQERISLGYMQRHAASPDQFVYERIGQYASGDDGLPKIDLSDPDIAEAFKDLTLPKP
jgi:NAD(P)-dependent dehydrogenase (short-subunit alcohol dehydrogenase family)